MAAISTQIPLFAILLGASMGTDAQRQNDSCAIGTCLDGLHTRVNGVQQMVVQHVTDGI